MNDAFYQTGVSDTVVNSFVRFYKERVQAAYGKQAKGILSSLSDESIKNEFIQDLAGIWFANTFGDADAAMSYRNVLTGTSKNSAGGLAGAFSGIF